MFKVIWYFTWMNRKAISWLLTATFITTFFFTPITAQAQNNAAETSVRAVIEGQITAFQSQDFATAYSFAAPQIKRIFQNQDRFISMVRSQYLPVYAPQSYEFVKFELIGNRSAMELSIVGPKGDGWRALYQLQKQSDDSWKITGVYLQKDAAGV